MKSAISKIRHGLLVLPLILFFVIGTGTAEASNWKTVSVSGQEYVSAQNVQKFYGFGRYAREGSKCLFRNGGLVMIWTTGSKLVFINNTKFNLSFPIRESSGKALISTIDLSKLIDPVLRPSYIKSPITFDRVVIDPGHGGVASGAKGRKGIEKVYTLDLSLKLEKELKKRGFKTTMTRRTDKHLTLAQRVALANKEKDAIFISIHFNSGSSSARGIETYSLAPQGTRSTNGSSPASRLQGHRRDAENIALATAVHAHVIHDLNAIDRGIKRAQFSVLCGINKPAILFEGGFITNPAEAAIVDKDSYRQELAESIANAVVKFQESVREK